MKSLVSIIVPVYGAEKYLNRCLKSLTKQTHTNLEIVLVDDGSKDNSGLICDQWASTDGRIKVIHQQNAGVSSARNAALKIITGEFFIAVDPDDILVLNAIECLLKAIEETNSDVAMFKLKISFEHGEYKKMPSWTKKTKYFVKEGEAMHREIFFSMAYQTFFCNKFYRTQKVKDIYLKDGLNCYEDIEAVPRFLKACDKAVFLNSYLLMYLIRFDSLSHDSSRFEQRLNLIFKVYELNIERYNNWYPKIGSQLHHRVALEYILITHDIFNKMNRKEKNKLLFNKEIVNKYRENSKGFLHSPFPWYLKVLYLNLEFRLLFKNK